MESPPLIPLLESAATKRAAADAKSGINLLKWAYQWLEPYIEGGRKVIDEKQRMKAEGFTDQQISQVLARANQITNSEYGIDFADALHTIRETAGIAGVAKAIEFAPELTQYKRTLDLLKKDDPLSSERTYNLFAALHSMRKLDGDPAATRDWIRQFTNAAIATRGDFDGTTLNELVQSAPEAAAGWSQGFLTASAPLLAGTKPEEIGKGLSALASAIGAGTPKGEQAQGFADLNLLKSGKLVDAELARTDPALWIRKDLLPAIERKVDVANHEAVAKALRKISHGDDLATLVQKVARKRADFPLWRDQFERVAKGPGAKALEDSPTGITRAIAIADENRHEKWGGVAAEIALDFEKPRLGASHWMQELPEDSDKTAEADPIFRAKLAARYRRQPFWFRSAFQLTPWHPAIPKSSRRTGADAPWTPRAFPLAPWPSAAPSPAKAGSPAVQGPKADRSGPLPATPTVKGLVPTLGRVLGTIKDAYETAGAVEAAASAGIPTPMPAPPTHDAIDSVPIPKAPAVALEPVRGEFIGSMSEVYDAAKAAASPGGPTPIPARTPAGASAPVPPTRPGRQSRFIPPPSRAARETKVAAVHLDKRKVGEIIMAYAAESANGPPQGGQMADNYRAMPQIG